MATISNVYRSYSMEYGTFVGLGWSAMFLCYVRGLVQGSALLILLCMVLGLVCLVMPFMLALRLNRKLREAGERLNYWRGLLFAVSMFMYACLISGIAAFAYFQFVDGGALYEQVHGMIASPEMASMYKQMGMGDAYAQMQDALAEMQGMSALDMALLLFNNNFMFSIVMSFLVAIAASWSPSGGGGNPIKES